MEYRILLLGLVPKILCMYLYKFAWSNQNYKKEKIATNRCFLKDVNIGICNVLHDLIL